MQKLLSFDPSFPLFLSLSLSLFCANTWSELQTGLPLPVRPQYGRKVTKNIGHAPQLRTIFFRERFGVSLKNMILRILISRSGNRLYHCGTGGCGLGVNFAWFFILYQGGVRPGARSDPLVQNEEPSFFFADRFGSLLTSLNS